jgi:SAM-dependent methyltransferase
MPDRFVFAVHIRSRDGKSLLVRRRVDAAEFPDFWSIPTKRVEEALFRRAAVSLDELVPVVSQLSALRRPHLEATVRVDRRKRKGYDLWMKLFTVTVDEATPLNSEKYPDCRWLDSPEIERLFPRGGGMCVAMLINGLIERGDLSTATRFVEIPPELADRETSWPSNLEVWKGWGFDQYAGSIQTGGIKDGFLQKTLTVDRYFRRRAEELRDGLTSAIDLGCGNGSFVRYLHDLGLAAVGVDVAVPPNESAGSSFHAGDLETEDIVAAGDYDLVSMNLLLPWIADLDGLLGRVRKIAAPGCRILASILAPDYAKNGDWHPSGGRTGWLISEPVRRGPSVVMINHTVGPLQFYPRTILDYVSAFAGQGMRCDYGSYLFLDSEMTEEECRSGRFAAPEFDRHRDFPTFAVMEFIAF